MNFSFFNVKVASFAHIEKCAEFHGTPSFVKQTPQKVVKMNELINCFRVLVIKSFVILN